MAVLEAETSPSPWVPDLSACGGLASRTGCSQHFVLGKNPWLPGVDTNKTSWSTCSELDISHFSDAIPACVGLSKAWVVLVAGGFCSAPYLGWNVFCRG